MLAVKLSGHWADRRFWSRSCPDTGLAEGVGREVVQTLGWPKVLAAKLFGHWVGRRLGRFGHRIVVTSVDFDHQVVSLSLFDGAVSVSAFWTHKGNNVCD